MAAIFLTSGMAWVILLACVLLTHANDFAPESIRFGSCIVRKYPHPWDLERGVWFNHTDRKELDLRFCHIKEIQRGDYNDVPNVIIINLKYNEISQVDTAAFKSVSKLKELILSGNLLRDAPVFNEDSVSSLVKLSLNRNVITGIYNSETFFYCTALEELDLSSNLIEYLYPRVFRGLYNLKRLYLQGNKLTSVPTLPSGLTELWLNHNRFKYLPSNFVSTLKNAKDFRLFFSNNPWHCACLRELLVDVKRVGVTYYGNYNNVTHAPYDGVRLECLFLTRDNCDIFRNTLLVPRTIPYQHQNQNI